MTSLLNFVFFNNQGIGRASDERGGVIKQDEGPTLVAESTLDRRGVPDKFGFPETFLRKGGGLLRSIGWVENRAGVSRGCQGHKGGERAGKTTHKLNLQQSKGKPLFIACRAEKINHCG